MADYNANIDKIRNVDLMPLYNGVISRPTIVETGQEPVTLDEAKAWDKIDLTTDDLIIQALITAARRMCEAFTGISFISKDIIVAVNNSDGNLQLPYGPIVSGPSATDMNGNPLTLTYQFGGIQSPRGYITLTYSAGYADGELPLDLKQAVLSQILFLYENRGESYLTLSPITQLILEPLREVV